MNILWFGVFFSAIRMLIGGVSAIYLVRKGISIEEIGYLKAFQAFIILTLDIPISYTVDKYSKSASILTATFCSAIWLLLTGIGNSFSVFLAAELFNALSLVFFGGAFVAMLLNGVSDNDKRIVLSRYQKWQHLAMSIAALVGPLFVINVSNGTIWLVSAVLMSILFLVGLVSISDRGVLKNEKKGRNNLAALLMKDGREIYKILSNVWYILLFAVIVGLLYQSLIQFWQPYLGYFGNLGEQGYIWGVVFFAILMIQSLAASCVQWFDRKRTVTFIIPVCTLFAMLFGVFWCTPTISQILMVMASFFIVRVLSIVVVSWFHMRISDNFRATADAIKATLGGILLIFLMPWIGSVLGVLVAN